MSDQDQRKDFNDIAGDDLDELYLYEAYREGVHRLHSSEYLFDFQTGKYHAFSVARTTPGFWAADGKIVDAVPVFLSKFDKEDPYRALVQKHLDEEWLKESLADGHLEEFDYCRKIDGVDRWFRMALTAVCMQPGEEVRFVVVATTDITELISEHEKMREELTITNARLKREMSILRAFKNIYFISFSIDINSELAHVIEAPEDYKDFAEKVNGDLRQTIQMMSQNLVAPEYAETFIKFLEPRDIDKRLPNSNLLSCDFFTKTGMWCRCHLIVVSKDRNNKIELAICAVQNITEEKEKEIRLKQALAEASEKK
ncbi:MAG: PAS domain-containing protein [Treponema sp.]|nr:PAS domain-containing protein [Treponema sp.]MBQ7618567.1 PAS domain-containing protein [Treponema sp.]MBQ9626152.1 PAS domain-containing protein [Treponema sp.]